MEKSLKIIVWLIIVIFSIHIGSVFYFNKLDNNKILDGGVNNLNVTTKTESGIIVLEPIIVTAKKDDDDIKQDVKENIVVSPDNKENKEEPKPENKLTLSEEVIKNEILNDDLDFERKKRLIESLMIDLQSKLDTKNLLENKQRIFSPGFAYSTYEYRKTPDKDFDFDFLINLKPVNITKNLNDKYIKLIQKYLDSNENLKNEELSELKIILGLFACSEMNGYFLFKEINELYNIKTFYVLENFKKEKDYVYYSPEECTNINTKLK